MSKDFKIITLTRTQQYPIKRLKLGACFLVICGTLYIMSYFPTHNLALNYIFSSISFLLLGFEIFLLCRWYIRSERKRKTQIARLLRYLLHTNNLYTTATTEKYDGDKKYTEKYIDNSAILGYWEDESDIIIRAYKEGDNFTDKMNNLDTGLSALLQLPLDNKVETVSYCDYIFKIHKDNRLVVADDELVFNDSVILPLSDNLSSVCL